MSEIPAILEYVKTSVPMPACSCTFQFVLSFYVSFHGENLKNFKVGGFILNIFGGGPGSKGWSILCILPCFQKYPTFLTITFPKVLAPSLVTPGIYFPFLHSLLVEPRNSPKKTKML